jgi:hypothetical protein
MPITRATSNVITDLAITTAKIADGAVATAKIADLAVTTGKIADGAVTNAKIPSGEIASSKLAPITATGSTTARAIADRFADVVNVKDFGAKGDGVTDDTAAIQAAINSVSSRNGGEVRFNAGQYKVSSQLTVSTSGVKLIGVGAEAYAAGVLGTEIAWFGSSAIGTTILFLQFCDACVVEGISFNCRNLAEYGIQAQGVKLSNFRGFTIRDFTFAGFYGYCGNLAGQWSNTNHFENFLITCANNGVIGLYLDGSSVENNDWFNNVFINGFVQVARTSSSSKAALFDFCDSNTFIECDFNVYGTGNGDAMEFRSTTRDFYPENNFFYSCSINSIKVTEGSGKFIGDQFFYAFTTKDNEILPDHRKLRLITDVGSAKGMGDYEIRKSTGSVTFRAPTVNTAYRLLGNINDSDDFGFVVQRTSDLSTYNTLTVVNSLGHFFAGSDNLQSIGTPTFRWSVVYAGTGTISTSDEREKQQIEPIDPAILSAWKKVNFKQFKFNDAVEKKGDDARLHIGVIAQQVKEAFESEGLDAFEYGLLCYDEWDAQDEIKDDEGNVIQPAREAGNRYGVRYEECLALECAYQRIVTESLLERIEALESK